MTEHIMSTKVDWRKRADCMTTSVAVCNCDGTPPPNATTVRFRYSVPLTIVEDITARLVWQL